MLPLDHLHEFGMIWTGIQPLYSQGHPSAHLLALGPWPRQQMHLRVAECIRVHLRVAECIRVPSACDSSGMRAARVRLECIRVSAACHTSAICVYVAVLP